MRSEDLLHCLSPAYDMHMRDTPACLCGVALCIRTVMRALRSDAKCDPLSFAAASLPCLPQVCNAVVRSSNLAPALCFRLTVTPSVLLLCNTHVVTHHTQKASVLGPCAACVPSKTHSKEASPWFQPNWSSRQSATPFVHPKPICIRHRGGFTRYVHSYMRCVKFI